MHKRNEYNLVSFQGQFLNTSVLMYVSIKFIHYRSV